MTGSQTQTSGSTARMRLQWSSRSPFVRKVLIAAHELGIGDKIELVPAFVTGEDTGS
jgi:glutathione S-transferase